MLLMTALCVTMTHKTQQSEESLCRGLPIWTCRSPCVHLEGSSRWAEGTLDSSTTPSHSRAELELGSSLCHAGPVLLPRGLVPTQGKGLLS